MILLFCIVYFLLFIYGVIMFVPVLSWFSALRRKSKNTGLQQKTVSVIIPCRNEEKRIQACLSFFATATFNKALTEIIVVNDGSEDGTGVLIREFMQKHPDLPVRMIELANNSLAKKGALMQGISQARGEIILSLDADCVPADNDWLLRMTAPFDEEETAMVIGAIHLNKSNGLLFEFLYCEHVLLQASGGGFCLLEQPYLCNGANLAFRRRVFEEVGGYAGNEHISSGDDIFLLQKIRRAKKYRIAYCADAPVQTFIPEGLKQVLSQKLRWAGKFGPALSWQAFFTGLPVFGIHCLFIILTLLSCVFQEWYKYLILCVLLKWIIDFLLLILASSQSGRRSWIAFFPLLQVINIVYAVFIPLAVLFVKAEWKGRSLKR